jgi:RNA polymerase sigma factor (sigma-70 family)
VGNSGLTSEAVGHLRTLFGAGGVSGLTDGQLLERFATRGDGAAGLAFAALVEKHGPTVLNVCLVVLRDRHDAEDAFQATFLVLARRAGTIRKRDSVASWLYGVALRVASEARAAAARRRAHEQRAGAAARKTPDDRAPCDLGPLLHEELGRLPERYRAPVLLCYLEGLSQDEAAQRLGWPVGTVKSRLARGKARLRDRLTRRGLAPTAVFPGLGPSFVPEPVTLPAALAEATVAAVAPPEGASGVVSSSVEALVRGTVKAMVLTRMKLALLTVLSVGALCACVGVLLAGEQDDRRVAPPPPAANGGQAEAAANDHAAVVALERRVRDLERRLDALAARADVEPPAAVRLRPDPTSGYKVRPRFECLVEDLHVEVGQKVKKGDALADLFSSELAAAKNACLSKLSQLQADQQLYDMRKKLYEKGAVAHQEWLDVQHDLQKSRLDAGAARDRLQIFGLSVEEIGALSAEQDGEKKARFTLRAPVAGTVIRIEVQSQDLADPKSVLFVIDTARP